MFIIESVIFIRVLTNRLERTKDDHDHVDVYNTYTLLLQQVSEYNILFIDYIQS